MKVKTTPTRISSSKSECKELPIEPKASILCNILMYAATYSADKLTSNSICDMLMN